jgi:TRAP-type C4-dicarboxylate transport system permease large subunit
MAAAHFTRAAIPADAVPCVDLLILYIALVMFVPQIALWLPGTMQYK